MFFWVFVLILKICAAKMKNTVYDSTSHPLNSAKVILSAVHSSRFPFVMALQV